MSDALGVWEDFAGVGFGGAGCCCWCWWCWRWCGWCGWLCCCCPCCLGVDVFAVAAGVGGTGTGTAVTVAGMLWWYVFGRETGRKCDVIGGWLVGGLGLTRLPPVRCACGWDAW